MTKKGKYQLAYGHHRLEAIKKVGIEELENIPVKDLNDAMMIKMMANENLDQWKTNPKVINESVRVTKKFLDDELAKYDSWKEIRSNDSIRPIFDTEPQFRSAKGKGVGQTIILKFLGEPPWKQHMIQEALAQLKESKEMREAEEIFTTQNDAKVFRKVSKKIKIKIPEGNEKKVAKKVAKKVDDRREEIKKEQIENKKGGIKTGEIRTKVDRDKDIEIFTTMEVEKISEQEARLKDLESIMDGVNKSILAAYRKILFANDLFKDLGFNEIKGLGSWFIVKDIEDLLSQIEILMNTFGYVGSKGKIKLIKED